MSKEILKKYCEMGIKKIAFIISDDLVAQVSIEQAIQESKDTDTLIKYFGTEEKAQRWLEN